MHLALVRHDDACRHRRLHLVTQHAHGEVTSCDQPIARHLGGLVTGGVEQQAELIPRQPGNQAILRRQFAKPPTGLAQHLVTGDVAERVVDELEAIEIHRRDRKHARLVRALCHRPQKCDTIRRLRQRIVISEVDCPALVRGQFRRLLAQQNMLPHQPRPDVAKLPIGLPSRGKTHDCLANRVGIIWAGEKEDLVCRRRDISQVHRRIILIVNQKGEVQIVVSLTQSVRHSADVGVLKAADQCNCKGLTRNN